MRTVGAPLCAKTSDGPLFRPEGRHSAWEDQSLADTAFSTLPMIGAPSMHGMIAA